MKLTEEQKHIRELASGSHDAFNYLFRKYYLKVKFFIIQIVKTEAIAEELSQDIFEKVWNHREKMIGIDSFNSYLYRMAKNTALNYLDHKFVEDTYATRYFHSEEFSFEEELDAKETELLIQFTIENMPEQRKKVFLMSRVENLNNEEIAKKLNLTKSTVKKHLNLALKQIRRALESFILF